METKKRGRGKSKSRKGKSEGTLRLQLLKKRREILQSLPFRIVLEILKFVRYKGKYVAEHGRFPMDLSSAKEILKFYWGYFKHDRFRKVHLLYTFLNVQMPPVDGEFPTMHKPEEFILPRGLQKVYFHQFTRPFFDMFTRSPKHKLWLHFHFKDVKLLMIEKFMGNNSRSPLSGENITLSGNDLSEEFRKSLEGFKVGSERYEEDYVNFNVNVNMLFPNLKFLHWHGTIHTLETYKTFPPSLTELELWILRVLNYKSLSPEKHSVSLSHLPLLDTLELQCCVFREMIIDLPSGIKNLVLGDQCGSPCGVNGILENLQCALREDQLQFLSLEFETDGPEIGTNAILAENLSHFSTLTKLHLFSIAFEAESAQDQEQGEPPVVNLPLLTDLSMSIVQLGFVLKCKHLQRLVAKNLFTEQVEKKKKKKKKSVDRSFASFIAPHRRSLYFLHIAHTMRGEFDGGRVVDLKSYPVLSQLHVKGTVGFQLDRNHSALRRLWVNGTGCSTLRVCDLPGCLFSVEFRGWKMEKLETEFIEHAKRNLDMLEEFEVIDLRGEYDSSTSSSGSGSD